MTIDLQETFLRIVQSKAPLLIIGQIRALLYTFYIVLTGLPVGSLHTEY